MRRRNKITEADSARLGKNTTLRLIVVWAVFLFSAAAVFLWARAVNQRIVSEYQQSGNCLIPGEEGCREILGAVVEQVSPIYGSIMPNRYGSATLQNREVISIDFDIVVSDGRKTTTRLSKDKLFQSGQNSAGGLLYWDLYRLDTVQKGDSLTVTRWRNKIITVRLRASTADLYTLYHPYNDASIRFLPLRSIFFLLLIVLLIWTSYEALRNPK